MYKNTIIKLNYTEITENKKLLLLLFKVINITKSNTKFLSKNNTSFINKMK